MIPGIFFIIACLLHFGLALFIFTHPVSLSFPLGVFGWELGFRVGGLSASVFLAAAVFLMILGVYTAIFMRGKKNSVLFLSSIIFSALCVDGVFLAANLLTLLFFWEALLIPLWLMIASRGSLAFKTATKALIIVGVGDFCLMAGAALLWAQGYTLWFSAPPIMVNNTATSVAFILLFLGALSKAGALPFHSWIPDAADDAPLPFMALFPAVMEKLLGIYFLALICLEIFAQPLPSWLGLLMMLTGGITIIFAVLLALVQKDYKKLLSYHAISQVGYMVLGIGTGLPGGIIGGLFHMINNALYKSGLFLTSGSVERQAGTTDLARLGGLFSRMPITAVCFIITAVSISGVWPFNGFFSKELIYAAAFKRGAIFYIMAILGSFFTAASFLKLGHAAYWGKITPVNKQIKEAPFMMLMPTVVIALFCIAGGIFHQNIEVYITKIIPFLNHTPIIHNEGVGEISGNILVMMTLIILGGAIINHIFAFRMTGSSLKAAEHINQAPFLVSFYRRAENKELDPYEFAKVGMGIFLRWASAIEARIENFYEGWAPTLINSASAALSRMHSGNYAWYILWAVGGTISVIIFMLR